jgi:hypothetical protein
VSQILLDLARAGKARIVDKEGACNIPARAPAKCC